MKPLKELVHERKYRSLFFKKMGTVFLPLFIPLILLTLVIGFLIRDKQIRSLTADAQTSLTVVSSRTDALIGSCSNLSMTLNYEERVQNFSRYAFQPLTQRKLSSLKNLQSRLSAVASDDLIRNSFVLYTNDDNDFLASSTQASRLETFSSGNMPNLCNELKNQACNTPQCKIDGEDLVFYSSSAHNGTRITSLIFVPISMVSGLLRLKVDTDNSVFLLMNDDRIIASSDPSFPLLSSSRLRTVSSLSIKGMNYIVRVVPSSLHGWHYAILQPEEGVMTAGFFLLAVFIIDFLLVLVISFLISLYITSSLYRPIEIIMDLLKNPENGTIDYYRNYCEQYDELQLILTLIESSYFKHLAVSKELEEKNRKLQSAQNYALAAQMNPHFIFNTLDSLNWKIAATLKGSNEISTALCDFSKIIRYALNKKGLVFLHEEIECAKIYLRLKNSLRSRELPVNWEVDESLLNAKVPFLILQPLLENAITHGLRNNIKNPLLSIEIKKELNALRIDVIDNGCGFSPQKKEEVENLLSENIYYDTSSHMGIINTHNRIRLTFGAEWGITISSEDGLTIVTLRMPVTEL